MEVKLDKQYPLDVDAERAWQLLSDLKAVAGCMPGAEITEQLAEGSYKGAVKVKVGPAVAQFAGPREAEGCVTTARGSSAAQMMRWLTRLTEILCAARSKAASTGGLEPR